MPRVQWASHLLPVRFGDGGAADTVTIMQGMVDRAITDPGVIQEARQLVSQSGSRDHDGQISAIRAFLADHFLFVEDPLGHETIMDPRTQLDTIAQKYYVQGDCDDAATLGAGLGMAVGIPARFVTLGFHGPTGPYEHIYTELLGDSGWLDLDVTKSTGRRIRAATRTTVWPLGGDMGRYGDAAGAAIGTATLGPGLGTAVGSFLNLGGVFHSSAAGPNTDAAKQVLPMARSGNLAAVAAILTRTGIQTHTSQIPWQEAADSLPSALIALANQHFPGNNWSIFGAIDPSQVAVVAQQRAVYVPVDANGNPTSNTPSSSPNNVQHAVNQATLFGGLNTTTALILGAAMVFVAVKTQGGKRRRR